MGKPILRDRPMDIDERLATRPRRSVAIPVDVDRKYRAGLLKVAATVNRRVVWHIHNALTNGPSRLGYPEAAAYFGPDLIEKLLPTAPIIDTLEVAMPGFKKWLEVTGFADDKTMIKAFLTWAEAKPGMASAESALPAVRH